MHDLGCLKRVSDGCLEFTPSFTRQNVRHLSDTWSFSVVKTIYYGCLTECLKVSDRLQMSAVCLVGVSLGHPRPDTPDSDQTKGKEKS